MTVHESGFVLGGRYRLVREIARGGMAAVWEAHDALLDRRVAVKLLHPQFADEPEFLERFRREARAAASLNHPNVVQIYDVGEDAQARTPFIVMELVEGENLKDRIRRAAPLSDAEIRQIGAALAATLDYGHRRGIVHRDVKPQNVLLGEDGRPRLTDFGIAQALASSQLTRTGAVMGSVHYLAPELVRGKQASARSDVYGLGAVLYEMATGRVPFSGQTDLAIALAHVEETPPAPRALNAHLGPELEHIILRALAKAPEARYLSAADLAAELRNGATASGSANDSRTSPATAEPGAAPFGSPSAAASPAARGPDPSAAAGSPNAESASAIRAARGAKPAAAAAPSPAARQRDTPAGPTAPRRASSNTPPASPAAGNASRPPNAAFAYPAGPAPAGRRVTRPRGRGAGGGVLALLLLMAAVLVALGAGFFGLATLSREGLAPPEATPRPTAVPTAQATPPPQPIVVPPTEAPTATPQPSPSPVPPSPTATTLPPTPTLVPPTPAPRAVSVPQLRGKMLDDARAALQAEGLTVTVQGINVNVERNVVADQAPDAGTSLPPGSTVTLRVGTGNVTIPDVAGRPREQAIKLLQDNGFRVTVRDRRDPRVPAGAAIETRPAAGMVVPRGSDVELATSTGR